MYVCVCVCDSPPGQCFPVGSIDGSVIRMMMMMQSANRGLVGWLVVVLLLLWLLEPVLCTYGMLDHARGTLFVPVDLVLQARELRLQPPCLRCHAVLLRREFGLRLSHRVLLAETLLLQFRWHPPVRPSSIMRTNKYGSTTAKRERADAHIHTYTHTGTHTHAHAHAHAHTHTHARTHTHNND